MDFSTARSNMVKSQATPNRVVNPALLASLGRVSRERFVAEAFRDFAYSDLPIPLSSASGRTALTPLQLSWMIQALEVKPGDKVLVIGAGKGYEAALLADMGVRVFALESDETLAGTHLINTPQVEWRSGDLTQGWPEESPFDGILLCGAVPGVPNKPIGQLGKQGRLVAILGNEGDSIMQAVRMVGIAGGDRPEYLFETTTGMLPGFEKKERFKL